MDRGLAADLVDEAIRLRESRLKFLVAVNADPSLIDSADWHRITAQTDQFNEKYGQNEAWSQQNSVRFGTLAERVNFWKSRSRAIGYDPQPFIEQLDIPMLYIFAENDRNVPTAASIRYLQRLQDQSHKNIEIRVIPGVEHSMLSPAALIYGGHPDFINVIGPWASSKVAL
jgi:pimeloyl-ACP methyl ester carboxylesterase